MLRISVPGSGNRQAKIVLVGEQPGHQEMRVGKPFVGPSGQVLDECLASAGIVRSDLYITNVIKTLEFPLQHFLVESKDGRYWKPEAREYLDYLKSELLAIGPNVIGAIGNVALFALTNRWGITNWRGSVIESTLLPGAKVVPLIHPATVLPPKFVYTNKFLISFDLDKLRKESDTPQIRLTERRIRVAPSFMEAINFLDYCRQLGEAGEVLDFDIEVDMKTEEMSCFAVAYSPQDSMSIPLLDGRGDYFTLDQEAAIMQSITHLLESPLIAIRGQNLMFDLAFMLRRYGIKPKGEIHDTMIAQKIVMPDYPAGLNFITSAYTDIPYYKDDGKKWITGKGGTWTSFWMYNGMDVLATASAFPLLKEDLEKQGNLSTYDRQRGILPALLYMQEHGTRIDIESVMQERQEIQDDITKLQDELDALAGFHLNPNSPKQLKDYFYGLRKVTPYKKRSGSSFVDTVDDMALKRLVRKGFREAEIIQELRSHIKVLGNYLNVDKYSNDSRYRAAYKPVGTDTGRLSSSEDIFGEGGNQQNWPHAQMRHLKPDSGYVFYSFDLSQAENRIVAYVGRVVEMIEAFEQGLDIHSLTGALISGIPVDEIKRQDKENIPASLGGGKQTWRFWGKKANHGLNYDLGYRRFALLYEIPEADGRRIVDAYHRAYPGVRQSFHGVVKQMLYKDRTVTNLMGRKRLFMGKLDDETFKTAYAQIPQSTVADIINERGLAFIWNNQHIFGPLELLNQIHDSIGFQIPLSVPWIEHAKMLLLIKKSLETPLEYHGRQFVLPADLSMSLTLFKEGGKDFKARSIPASATELAEQLAEAYAALPELHSKAVAKLRKS